MEIMQPIDVIRAYGEPQLTLTNHLAVRVAQQPEKTFLMFGEKAWSYAEFENEANHLAAAFVSRGVERGARVAVIARNDPAHLLTLFALSKIAAIMVPVNPEFGVSELNYILGHAQVSGIVVAEDVREKVAEATASAQIAPFVLVIDGSDTTRDFSAAREEPASILTAVETSPGDACLIIYTSGTTGRPKGVVHSQQNFLRCGQINIARLHLQPDDVVMIVLPFFHVNALFYSVAGAFCAGATIFGVPRFSASNFWKQAADSKATTVNVIEAIGNILLARDRNEFRSDNRIRTIYGVRPRYEAAFRREFGTPHIVSGYGLTEIPGVTCGNLNAPNKEHSMGKVISHPDPDMEWASCRIVDDEGVEVPEGNQGELLIRSPAIMLGYYRDAEATRQAVRDGWFATGDIVRRDGDGEFFFVSRKKDIIRRRGENISGAELDIVIGGHPDVLEAAAIAVPAELGEDDILVVVVPRPGRVLTASEIGQWCAARLAPMKVPQFVTFANALPHTPTHKIAKAVLRADTSIRERAEKVTIELAVGEKA